MPRAARLGRVAGPLLAVAVAAFAAAQYAIGRPLAPEAWLAIAPLLASLALGPLRTTLLAGWTVLLGLGLALQVNGPAGRLASSLAVLALLAGFGVADSVLRSAAQRRLGQARAVARVAQSALLREVPRSVAAARLASRYVSASAEAQVGGDLVEVIADGANPRWLVGDTRGKGLPAVRLASVAATSFRDACARPGLPLIEVARAVDVSVTRAAGEEDFVTAVFAELDPAGWIQLVICGHPPPLRLSTDGELVPLAPAAFTAPLGLHPDLHLSTFSVRTGDRLLFFTDGLLEARDRAGLFFRVDQQIQALSRPDLQAAADELLPGCARTPAASSTTTSRCCWPNSPSPTPQSSLQCQASGPPRARPWGPHKDQAPRTPPRAGALCELTASLRAGPGRGTRLVRYKTGSDQSQDLPHVRLRPQAR